MLDPFTGEAQRIRRRRRWQKVSRLYRDAHPVCELCEIEGRTEPVESVDHVVSLVELLIEAVGIDGDPTDVVPDGAHDEANLQSLCGPCHSKKSAAERARGYNDRTPRQRSEDE